MPWIEKPQKRMKIQPRHVLIPVAKRVGIGVAVVSLLVTGDRGVCHSIWLAPEVCLNAVGNKMSRTRPPMAGSSRTAIGNRQNGEASRNRDSVARSRNWRATTVGVLALLALVFVAVGIVADTAGQSLAVSDPDGALLVAPWEPIALDELAQSQLTNTSAELSSVEDLARRALRSNPLDSRALSLLGLVAERNGDLARAEALMSLSAARSWRNPTPHVWLFAQAIRRGKFEEALAQADGLLRVINWRYEATIFPILAVFGSDPSGSGCA